MKFASFPKFAILSLLAGVFTLVLAGCGATKNTNDVTLTQGNWSLTAVPASGAAGTFYIGGNLTQHGSSLAASTYATGSCIDPSAQILFTGTAKGNAVTLTSASISGAVIAITASGSSSATTASALTGTYTVTGGCDDGDTGTVTANAVPSVSGTWRGPVTNSSGGSNVTIAIALTQAATASSDGTFALTGSVTFTNSSCSISGTLNSSSIAGPFLVVNANTNEQDGTTGSFSYTQVLLNNPGAPTSMTGTYAVTNTDEPCNGDQTTATLTN